MDIYEDVLATSAGQQPVQQQVDSVPIMQEIPAISGDFPGGEGSILMDI